MPSFALAAIGRDRPGIVAAVSKVLYEHGCNVEDSSMTLLRGNFSIMLILASPGSTTAEGLHDALQPACDELGLTFSVREVADTADVAHPSHILTVYGADRPGILYRVTDALASSGVNITDLNSRLIGGPDNPVYALMLELALSGGTSADTLDETLRGIAADVGVDLTLRPLDDDVL
jgi:glycine cleavage system transcriptional repressor